MQYVVCIERLLFITINNSAQHMLTSGVIKAAKYTYINRAFEINTIFHFLLLSYIIKKASSFFTGLAGRI